MACGSVATTSGQISKVIMGKEQLAQVLAQTLNVDPKLVRVDEGSYYRQASYSAGGVQYTISQWVNGNGKTAKIDLDFSLYGSGMAQAQIEARLKELKPAYDSAVLVGQQTAVLRKLQALGKLSNVQEKTNGVMATVELTITVE